MTSQPAARDNDPEQVTAPLPHGLVAIYTLKSKPKPKPPALPVEDPPWLDTEPPW